MTTRQWMEQYRPAPSAAARFRFAHPLCRTCQEPNKYTACLPASPDRRRGEDRRQS